MSSQRYSLLDSIPTTQDKQVRVTIWLEQVHRCISVERGNDFDIHVDIDGLVQLEGTCRDFRGVSVGGLVLMTFMASVLAIVEAVPVGLEGGMLRSMDGRTVAFAKDCCGGEPFAA